MNTTGDIRYYTVQPDSTWVEQPERAETNVATGLADRCRHIMPASQRCSTNDCAWDHLRDGEVAVIYTAAGKERGARGSMDDIAAYRLWSVGLIDIEICMPELRDD